MKKYTTLLIMIVFLVHGLSLNAMGGAKARQERRKATRTFLAAAKGEHVAADNAIPNDWEANISSLSSSGEEDGYYSPEDESSSATPAQIAVATTPKAPELDDEESQIGRLLKLRGARHSHLTYAKIQLDEIPKPNTVTRREMISQIARAVKETRDRLKAISADSKKGTQEKGELQDPIIEEFAQVIDKAYEMGLELDKDSEVSIIKILQGNSKLNLTHDYDTSCQTSSRMRRNKAVCFKLQAARHARNNHEADEYLSDEEYEDFDDTLYKVRELHRQEEARLDVLKKEQAAALAKEVAEQHKTVDTQEAE